LPASFARLRIAGFKSFAEPATLEVLPGLTGIVGPNGCGKSNVVEALRWAMGETSARSLRGEDMDDVIFAGTTQRPARNLAEVMLVLEETKSLAPPPFHEFDQLEIVRRIERGQGSAYRINGREARARDVQTLFADLASGARASAMVSQGRVGALVAARPEERRSILEEAAGITGLHARRHEAELKLRQAESNLTRAEDLRGQLESQLEGLRRQARQAARYRTVSAAIRNAEAELLSLQNARAETARGQAARDLADAQQAVSTAAGLAVRASEQADHAGLRLPGLRETEAQARTALERHRLAGEQIFFEISRAEAALRAGRDQLKRLDEDLVHAERQEQDAKGAQSRLDEEAARLAREEAAHPALVEAAQSALRTASDALRLADAEANRATETAAELAARRRAVGEALALARQRERRLRDQLAQLAAEQAKLDAALVPAARLAEARAAAEAAEARRALAAGAEAQAERDRLAVQSEATAKRDEVRRRAAELRQTARDAAETARTQSRASLDAARFRSTQAEAARARVAAEHRALAEVLGVAEGEKWPKLLDQLSVPSGLEQALGAALGEELDAAADPNAARHWREQKAGDLPALPEGATPLAALVQAPPLLARALSQIGLVEQASDALLAALRPGQSLITREGGLWRWDGYTVRAGSASAATVRLQQRNRLATLAGDLADAVAAHETEAAGLRAVQDDAQRAQAQAEQDERAAREQADRLEAATRAETKTQEDEATQAERAARSARAAADGEASRLRTDAAQLEAQSNAAAARAAALADQRQRQEAELAEAEAASAKAEGETAALGDPSAARDAVEQARAALVATREEERRALAGRDALLAADSTRRKRRATLEPERSIWAERLRDAGFRRTDLRARRGEAAGELARLEEAPVQLAARAQAARETLAAAEADHDATAGRLADADEAYRQAAALAREADQTLAAAREAAVRAEGEVRAANQAWGVVAERILERLGDAHDLPPAPSDVSQEAEDRFRRRHERMLREREEMGPVNLRAEIEANATEERIATIEREREEIATAIAKLRGLIGHLNREGRERLTKVFAEVDRQFQALFTRMFNGGRAHLAMVGSDDPLLAGLEIYAQPPGKKLSALSLLSGGEQALTALSLIFAVFRCNPAPVCVLDEVDAPLDDANVERFCTLLADMVRETGTRFLVVTHHALTMARMDRLYGVTMQERGVSRVLSVDLHKAVGMIEQVGK
jgi:chromosome segregation protein